VPKHNPYKDSFTYADVLVDCKILPMTKTHIQDVGFRIGCS